jgi:hypothetical protein
MKRRRDEGRRKDKKAEWMKEDGRDRKAIPRGMAF